MLLLDDEDAPAPAPAAIAAGSAGSAGVGLWGDIDTLDSIDLRMPWSSGLAIGRPGSADDEPVFAGEPAFALDDEPAVESFNTVADPVKIGVGHGGLWGDAPQGHYRQSEWAAKLSQTINRKIRRGRLEGLRARRQAALRARRVVAGVRAGRLSGGARARANRRRMVRTRVRRSAKDPPGRSSGDPPGRSSGGKALKTRHSVAWSVINRGPGLSNCAQISVSMKIERPDAWRRRAFKKPAIPQVVADQRDWAITNTSGCPRRAGPNGLALSQHNACAGFPSLMHWGARESKRRSDARGHK